MRWIREYSREGNTCGGILHLSESIGNMFAIQEKDLGPADVRHNITQWQLQEEGSRLPQLPQIEEATMTIHRLSLIFSHWLWCRYILEEVEQNARRREGLEHAELPDV